MTSTLRLSVIHGLQPYFFSWNYLAQLKPFSVTVIQVYVPTSNAEDVEVERFYEDLQDLLELTPKNYILLIIGDWNAKVEVKKHLE